MLRVCLLVLASAIACNAQAQCGRPAITPLSSSRVVGGVEAKSNSWPWQISLRLRNSFGDQHVCGGALITDKWIVTAAHCVVGKEASYFWNVWLGTHDVLYGDATTVKATPTLVIRHHGFNPSTFVDDIALIMLASPVALTDEVSPICLPSQTYNSGNAYVTGWGDTQWWGQGSYPQYLQQVMTPVMDHAKCNQKLFNMVGDTMICGGFEYGQQGACSGDSGGPYVTQTASGQWELAGVVSWGYIPCAQYDVPSVYTDVYHFLPWIQWVISSYD